MTAQNISSYSTSPEYLKAADLHNIGYGNQSMLDTALNAPANFAKFSAVSLASGVNSIYNTGVTVANWFGADAQKNDLATSLASFDSDLGAYYQSNREGADIVGFIATSFVPGLGGVKLFNMGQKVLGTALESGTMGSNVARAVGLVRTTDDFVVAASKELAATSKQFDLMNLNAIKAFGSGAQQAAWESLAFEASVAATMSASPILSNADYKDIASNMLMGTVLGGAIGGAFTAASTYGKISKAVKASDIEEKPWTVLSAKEMLQSPSDRILVSAWDIKNTPPPKGAETIGLYDSRITKLNQSIREDVRALTVKGDDILGNAVGDSLHNMDPDQIANVMRGATGVSRLAEVGKVGEGTRVGYVRLHGQDAGKITWDEPSVTSLADIYKTPDQVNAFVSAQKFESKKNFTMQTAGGMEVIQGRYIWAETAAKYTEGMTIHVSDIPLLEGALRNKLQKINITDGVHDYSVTAPDMYNEIIRSKMDLATELAKAQKAAWQVGGQTLDTDMISKMVNVSKEFLENTEGASAFLRADLQHSYDEALKVKGLPTGKNSNLDYIPQNIAVKYDSKLLGDEVEQGLTSAMVMIKQRQKIQQDAVNNVVSHAIGEELFGQMAHLTDEQIIMSNRLGAGAGLMRFSNGGYGTTASWAEQTGAVASRVNQKLTENTSLITDPAMTGLQSNQAAAIEFANINNTVTRSAQKYVLNADESGLILKDISDYRNGLTKEQPAIANGVPEEILFKSEEAGNAIIAQMQTHGSRRGTSNNLLQAQGLEGTHDPNVFYPLKHNPKDYPYIAFVKDNSVTGAGQGHTSMLFASTEGELQELIKMTKERTPFSVYTKKEAEDFYKARGEYEFDRTLHDNYIDSSLASRGIQSNPFPKTDPQKIVNWWRESESRADGVLSRELVSAKYANEFEQFKTLGEQFTNVSASRYGMTVESAEKTAKNPYLDYVKTALNISRLSEYPLLTAANRALENGMSAVYKRVESVWNTGKGANDLEKVNEALKEAGVSHAYKSAAEVMLANHSAPAPVLSKFIRGANSILAATFLRTDPLNALNNAVGAQVLLGKETASLIRGIRTKNPELAGKLSELLDIGVPGVADKIQAPGKLIANAMKDFVQGRSDEAMFKANGWMRENVDIYRSMLQDLTLNGKETEVVLGKKIEAAFAKAKSITGTLEKYTGNKLAEDFNRYVSANVAKQISDLGVQAGLIDAKTQLSYINTFVNRTQGNILASQRPLVFQGPIGQAIGLFQGFQFNTMQQLFRGVAESGAKDAALTLGLQGTIYGLNGLPGFQFINQHIVGTASGNPEHKDAYSLTYGVLGKTAGDWLMYGIPSNLIQTNLYTRGDINPRTLTVIPTRPEDVIAVSAFGKFAGNIFETYKKMAGGGDLWQSFLQGLEHNGISRPLQGLAQTLQATSNPQGKVYSTTGKGDISFVNDFFSLATLSRMLGGKPLDEALANDQISRSMVYKAKDRERIAAATEEFKTHIIGGKAPPSAAVDDYLTSYVKAGGEHKDFNKIMLNALTKVDTPRANEVINSLKGPYGQHMQQLLGGKLEGLND